MKALSELWLAIREDAPFAYRSLSSAPTYTTTVVVTSALAIGGITAAFSVLYAVVLRPLPFPEARQIIAVHTHHPRFGSHGLPSSPNEFLDIQSRNQRFSKAADGGAGGAHGDGRR